MTYYVCDQTEADNVTDGGKIIFFSEYISEFFSTKLLQFVIAIVIRPKNKAQINFFI